MIGTAGERIGNAQFRNPALRQHGRSQTWAIETTGPAQTDKPVDRRQRTAQRLDPFNEVAQHGGAADQCSLDHVDAQAVKAVAQEQMFDLIVTDNERHEVLQVEQVDGFTVPANVFGAARGSVTFATEIGTPFPEHLLVLAQAFGNILFQKVLDIGWARHLPKRDILTERQLECVMWVGRGKCNWTIATLMGLSVNTVKKHLRDACERYEFATRTTLPLQALYDGSLCISDVLS